MSTPAKYVEDKRLSSLVTSSRQCLTAWLPTHRTNEGTYTHNIPSEMRHFQIQGRLGQVILTCCQPRSNCCVLSTPPVRLHTAYLASLTLDAS